MKKELNYINIIPIIILIAMLFPFLGTLGFSVYTVLGKLYFVALVSICLVSLAYDFFNKKEIRAPKCFITITLLLAIPLLISLFYGKNFDYIGLIATCFIVFLYFYNSNITTKTISIIFQLFLVILLILVKVENLREIRCFNTNIYALIVMIAFMGTFLDFDKEKNKIYNFLLITFNCILAVYMSYIYFKSETELLAFFFFMITFFLLKKLLNHSKTFYIIFTIAIFLFTISFTGISYIAINQGILSPNFITGRGEIWVKAYNIILHSNIFSPHILPGHPHAHNGFLNFCLCYNLPSAIAFAIALIYSLLNNNAMIRDSNTNFVLYTMIMSFIFINSVESFITDFNTVYLFIIPLAILFRNISIQESRKNEK